VVSPVAVLEEIKELCKQTTVYPFLQMESEGAYLKPLDFVEQVRQRWLDIALDELTQAVGLVTRDQYDTLFQRYLRHVSHQQRGEKLENAITGRFEDADESFMSEMEGHFGTEGDAAAFRRSLLGRIGAASQSGPLGLHDFRELFPDLFDSLETSYYEAQKPTVRKTAIDALTVLADEDEKLSETDRKRVQTMLAELKSTFGYCEASAKESISLLISERLSD
jgi:predicted Ser/Thr protein kinase